jgi:hypothetical protein
MTLLSIAIPLQAAIPAAETFIGAVAPIARPLLGLSAVVAFLLIFKPLLVGLLRAALLLVKPRQSIAERKVRSALRDVVMLNRMARELESSQPSLAAELRGFACRG